MTATSGAAVRMLDAGPRYSLLKALGEGSFGVVYRAQLVGTGQEVALKTLTRVRPEALLRFKREFRALSEISHPNLVGLRELFEHAGQWLIAMDLVEGVDLLSWVRRSVNDNGIDEARVRKAFADVAQGLAALHAHGLLHRDLKPSNVRVTPEGKAVVLDFGLVTMADEELQSTHRSGVGTLAYMAPEQVSGDKLTPAVDLYALGASLYEALTGKLPLTADTAFALMLRKANEDPAPPRRLAPQVPFELDGLCTALLERNPKARPSLESVLRSLLGEKDAPRSLAPAHASGGADDGGVPFEGREAELSRLAAALARTHEGEQSVVLLEGESGIGKSALVAELVRRELAARPEAWVLSGRCYEHEHVPYKAFDACMDGLAKRLGGLSPEVCALVLPRRAGLLVVLTTTKLVGLRARTTRGSQASTHACCAYANLSWREPRSDLTRWHAAKVRCANSERRRRDSSRFRVRSPYGGKKHSASCRPRIATTILRLQAEPAHSRHRDHSDRRIVIGPIKHGDQPIGAQRRGRSGSVGGSLLLSA